MARAASGFRRPGERLNRRRILLLVLAAALVVGAVVSWPLLREPDPLLSNGCAYSARGVPGCGMYVGAAVGGNDDPTVLEDAVGARLGVRRTYWRSGQLDQAVRVAQEDLAVGRLPWVSFKLDTSWSEAADGAMDGWARDLARKVAALPGPVWVAFHHEPEGDGDIQQWRGVQERLGPILRGGAPNAAFTVILTGWNQFFGPSEYSLDRIWPDTPVDVLGVDVYQRFGMARGGGEVTEVSDLRTQFYDPISRWAKEHGVRWAVSETGVTDVAASERPDLLGAMHHDLAATGAVALTYFDSTLNSTGSWALGSGPKREQLGVLLRDAPTLPVLG